MNKNSTDITPFKKLLLLFLILLAIDVLSKFVISMAIESGHGRLFFNHTILIGNVKHYASNRYFPFFISLLGILFLLKFCFLKIPTLRIPVVLFASAAFGNTLEILFFGYATNWFGILIGKVNKAWNLADLFLMIAMILFVAYVWKEFFRYIRRAFVNAH